MFERGGGEFWGNQPNGRRAGTWRGGEIEIFINFDLMIRLGFGIGAHQLVPFTDKINNSA